MVDTPARLKAVREFRDELTKLDRTLDQYEGTIGLPWNIDLALGQTAALQGWVKSLVETHLRLLSLSLAEEDYYKVKEELSRFVSGLPAGPFPARRFKHSSSFPAARDPARIMQEAFDMLNKERGRISK